jgi:mono/diheme cytochrome c family protein
VRRNRLFWLTLIPAISAAWLLVAPPRWWLNLTRPVDRSRLVETGAQLVDDYNCRRCHRIAGRGSLMAADLNRVTERLDRDTLLVWLRNPKQLHPDTAMPDLHLSDDEIDAIVTYLGTVK